MSPATQEPEVSIESVAVSRRRKVSSGTRSLTLSGTHSALQIDSENYSPRVVCMDDYLKSLFAFSVTCMVRL